MMCEKSWHTPRRWAKDDYARESFPPGGGAVAGALDLMQRIRRDFAFDGGATDVSRAAAGCAGSR
jgi:hypothetical protein